MGSFLTRGLVMVFGYAYPAYECFKTVEKNKPEIEHLRFWCQYWILVAVLTVFERVGDTFISWLPMYGEAKLAFYIYLWYPKTKGTTYVYGSFFRPYIAKHEIEIDRHLLELRARAGDMALMYWQMAATYGQARVFEILQFIASQSIARPRPAQQQQQGGGEALKYPTPQSAVNAEQQQQQVQKPPSRASSLASTTEKQQHVPASRTSSLASTEKQQHVPASEAAPAAVRPQRTTGGQPSAEAASQSTRGEAEAMQIEPVPFSGNGNVNSQPEESVMEEAIRVTRGRLRKTRTAANQE
ncbi:PREDICTED: putative HVA22-like protein g isoform X1 [Nelumbo nucifera]|uniref:HVA22-like protein n=1 Tax=Nelumbo nucifera TaxID=4432 RepID=A0A1U8A207_NELNU|nr:PREDICTED: putative HVA22-like protein g isoform X1 [Nelumbo nucifera]XP_010255154.1 PREDICTED: putative HVA22-like protein g isoform X1 [Nelumbo nucifera]XP_010255155.1 PREDICTED: putative HVA22-like protein g isoform X1 [Nelumbo nucifera]